MQTHNLPNKTQVLVPLNSSETLKNHFHVAVRLKPMESSGTKNKKICPWSISNDNMIRMNSKESYLFDSVFSQTNSTEQIFNKDLHNILHNALKGYNATILAYG